jgi:hypothetical protein
LIMNTSAIKLRHVGPSIVLAGTVLVVTACARDERGRDDAMVPASNRSTATAGLAESSAPGASQVSDTPSPSIPDSSPATLPTTTIGAQAGSTAVEPRVAPEDTAIRTALAFLEARNAWDGRAMRALVADDADVDDFAVEAPDDYLAMAVLERTLQWQYLDPECSARLDGAVAHVRCTYLMQNRLSQATGTGPYSGSRMDFAISDALIQMVTNTFDHSLYGDEVLVPYTEWLNAQHPGDVNVMFFTNESGEVNRSLSAQSLALWAEHVPEYVAVEGAS